MIKYERSTKEIDAILKTLTIIIDTRETLTHTKEWFESKGIKYVDKKLDTGDYSAYLPANVELGIARDTYFDIVVERKNSIDEIASNLSKTNEKAFIAELERSKELDFTLFVEDPNYFINLLNQNYRSAYSSKALTARLESLQAKYQFNIVPVPKELMAYKILGHMHYRVRNLLKQGLL